MSKERFNIDKIKNIIAGANKHTKIGYTPSLEDVKRKEGDEWTDDNNNTWIIKNGIRVKKPKESKIIHRKICDDCKRDIRFSDVYYLDIQTWNPTGLCHECFFKRETKLKQENKWELFNKERDLKSEKASIEDNIKKFTDAKNWCVEQTGKPLKFLNSDGSEDNWNCNDDLSVLIKNVTDDLQFLNERLEKVNIELENIEKQKISEKNV